MVLNVAFQRILLGVGAEDVCRRTCISHLSDDCHCTFSNDFEVCIGKHDDQLKQSFFYLLIAANKIVGFTTV